MPYPLLLLSVATSALPGSSQSFAAARRGMIGAPCTVPSTKTGEGATLAGVPSAAGATALAATKFFPESSSSPSSSSSSRAAPAASKTTTTAAATSTILDRAREEIASGREESFLVMDMNVVRSQAARWRRELPRVLPLYAVKCQPDVEVIKTLAGEGFGFDVASKREMELVLEHAVPRGLAADRVASDVIYANPCKMTSHIRAVSQMGVRMTTLDNVDELRKIHAVWPSAKLVVRILGDDTFSVCQFNKKFGLNVDDMPPLLVEAKRLGMDVVGVSFHVGSGCTSAVPFAKAIESAHRAFDVIEAHGFPRPRFLDLGGGWPGTPEGVSDKHASFEDICALVRPTLDRLFPPESGVKIVAEPGRYFVAACGTLYTAVHARRAIFSELPELLPNQSLHDGSSAHDTDDGVFSAGGLTSPSPAPHQQAASPVQPQVASPKARAATAAAAAAANPAIRGFRIYINEGTYGCFNAIANDHMDVHPSGFIHADGSLFDGSSSALYECSVWGPTCDSVDLISSSMPLPELNIGDWVEWSSFGAYTSAAVASFNGLRSAEIIHINAA